MGCKTMVWLSVGTAMSAAKSQENVREFKSAWRVVTGAFIVLV